MTKIPKTFHFVWFGDAIPREFEDYIDGWRAHHDSWIFNLWNEDDLFQLDNQALFDHASDYVPEHRVGQFRGDIARYEILYRFGGVYVDCDFESRQPIDDLLRADLSCFAAWEATGRWINNAILGAVPEYPFLRGLIDGLPARADLLRGKFPGVISGPQYLTQHYLQTPDEMVVFPKSWFYPYLWNELDRAGEEFPDAYAVHHWANAQRRRRIDRKKAAA